MAQSKARATYEDLMKLPDHVVGEILDGELIVSPRPAARHALAASVLGHHLVGPFQLGSGGPGGWWILDEPELHLGQDVLVPDLAGWRRERMPKVPDVVAFELAPDWTCEILSPSTTRIDRGIKTDLYRRYGVPYYWIVDADARTVEAYGLADDRYALLARVSGAGPVSLPPFPDLAFAPASLWP